MAGGLSGRIEADDTVDQIEAEQEFGTEVSAHHRLDNDAPRQQRRLFATRGHGSVIETALNLNTVPGRAWASRPRSGPMTVAIFG